MKKEEMTIKQRLAKAGVTVERLYNNGQFAGVRLMKNGHQCHTSHQCNSGYGISLCEFFGV